MSWLTQDCEKQTHEEWQAEVMANIARAIAECDAEVAAEFAPVTFEITSDVRYDVPGFEHVARVVIRCNDSGLKVEAWERSHDGSERGKFRALVWAAKWARFHARANINHGVRMIVTGVTIR